MRPTAKRSTAPLELRTADCAGESCGWSGAMRERGTSGVYRSGAVALGRGSPASLRARPYSSVSAEPTPARFIAGTPWHVCFHVRRDETLGWASVRE